VCDNLVWLDALMAGKQFVVGPRFTVADIILYAALDFGSTVGQALDTRYQNLTAWLARAAAADSHHCAPAPHAPRPLPAARGSPAVTPTLCRADAGGVLFADVKGSNTLRGW